METKKTNTQNLYFATMYGRSNPVKEAIYNFFQSISSWPKLTLEVYLRSRMGQRHYSLFGCIMITLILAVIPFWFKKLTGSYYSASTWDVIWKNATWYLFLLSFIFMSIKRAKESMVKKGVFKFDKFTLSTGYYHTFFDIKIFGRPANPRQIETIVEPGFCLIIGLAFCIFGQILGILICFCSIVYSISKMAAYHKSDEFLFDAIDTDVCNRGLKRRFYDFIDDSDETGFRYVGDTPEDPEQRDRMYKRMVVVED